LAIIALLMCKWNQMWMRAARAEPGPVLLVATEIAPTGHRLPR
jgi:hypothetical protein